MMMRKNIRRVRRDIQRRRRLKNKHTIGKNVDQIEVSFPNEQDKHGEVQLYPKYVNQQHRFRLLTFSTTIKVFLSVAIFLFAFLTLQTTVIQSPLPKHWLQTQLTKEFPFATVNAWYFEKFGRPLAFNPEQGSLIDYDQTIELPVVGQISESFFENGQGIKISPQTQSLVTAWKDGIVIFTGNNRQTKKTITIQHADQSETTYGYLSSLDVHPYQYVAAGQVIGKFQPTEQSESVYFSIEKDNVYLDPIQVIQVDDR